MSGGFHQLFTTDRQYGTEFRQYSTQFLLNNQICIISGIWSPLLPLLYRVVHWSHLMSHWFNILNTRGKHILVDGVFGALVSYHHFGDASINGIFVESLKSVFCVMVQSATMWELNNYTFFSIMF